MTEKKAWGEGLETGVAEIDGEHRLQIELVRSLEEALGQRDPRVRGGEVLKQLLDYTNVHFLAEDLMMRLHAYPGYQAHVREHEKLVGQLEEVQRHFAAGEFGPSRELVAALKHWLAEHIQTMDRGFAAFLKAGGARPSP